MAKPFEELLKNAPAASASARDRVSRLLAEMPLKQDRVKDKTLQSSIKTPLS